MGVFYKSHRNILGFTLIEIMITIALMGVLAISAFGTYVSSLKRGRDAKRKSDLSNIQTSLEQFYTICGQKYPTPAGAFYTSVVCTEASSSILPTVPMDPNNNAYTCPTPAATSCAASGYTICATLEAESPNSYCVTSKQ